VPILVGFALLLVLLAYLAVRWLFRPIATIRTGAAYIGAGHFGHRIRTRREDELGELAGDINRMAGKVEGMLDAKRQLLLGVSHELRSPISRLTLGLALQDDTAATQGLRADVEEMRGIVETLLDAERLEARHSALQREAVVPADLVRDLVARFFGGESRLQLTLATTPAAMLDVARVQLMLKNLVGNALRFSAPEDGPVQITVAGDDASIEFRVRDHGPGIAPDQRAGLGEPFYRPDASRTRDTGGTGLGLFLARQIARAHGGELVLEDVAGRGALFVVRLPRVPPGEASDQPLSR
jgi:signal transduction histidine kinase